MIKPDESAPKMQFHNPNENAPAYEPTVLTDEEKEKFKLAPDGLPYRFPEIWALSAREPEDPFRTEVLTQMHSLINNWPIEETYDYYPDFPDTH